MGAIADHHHLVLVDLGLMNLVDYCKALILVDELKYI